MLNYISLSSRQFAGKPISDIIWSIEMTCSLFCKCVTDVEEKFGDALRRDRLDEHKAATIIYELKSVSVANETDWKQMSKFHAEYSRKMCDAILPVLKELYPATALPKQINDWTINVITTFEVYLWALQTIGNGYPKTYLQGQYLQGFRWYRIFDGIPYRQHFGAKDQ